MNTRKLFLFLSCLFGLTAVQAIANGVIRFDNIGVPADQRIYRGDWVLQNGQPEFVSWQPCSGPTFRAALYWGSAGATA